MRSKPVREYGATGTFVLPKSIRTALHFLFRSADHGVAENPSEVTAMHRRGKRRPLRFGSALGALAIVVVILAPAPAAFADCSPLDLTCVLNGGDEGTDGLPVGGLPNGGDHIVKKVADKGDGLLHTVGGTVGKVLHPGHGHGGGSGGGGGGGTGHGHGSSGRSGHSRSTNHGGLIGSSGVRALTTPADQHAATKPIPATDHRSSRSTLLGRLGEAAAAAAVTIGFPVLLALIVVAFLMLQGRIDRRDPKLALAPMKPDVARFE
jgi:hypothetical protein